MIISGIDRSRYFRQDFVDIGERFAQLIERICGIWPVLFVPVETERPSLMWRGRTNAVIRSPRAAVCCAVERFGMANAIAVASP